MPDWSYSTLTAPILRRLRHDGGRRFVNRFFARLGHLPHGYRVVDFLGHMAPEPSLAVTLPSGQRLTSSLFLAPCVDPEGTGAAAFSRFGFGALTFGPVSVGSPPARAFSQGDDGRVRTTLGPVLALADARTLEDRTGSARFFFELDPFDATDDPCAAIEQLARGLAERAAALILTPQRYDRLMALPPAARTELCERFVAVCNEHGVTPAIGAPVTTDGDALALAARGFAELGLALHLSGGGDGDGWEWGGESQREGALALCRALKDSGAFVMVDGGVRSPREADALRRAGADLIGIGPGLVHTGPGLPKRINETFHFFASREAGPGNKPGQTPVDSESPVRRAWLWGVVLGVSMLLGALLAGWSALTHVLLPYDETFLGRSAADIEHFNHRVLHFMTHDRVTLAGTMVSIGLLYVSLSVNAARHGEGWGKHVVVFSATPGFFSFFTFLGFGYLDPFHAFVTAVLLQFLIQVVVQPVGPRRAPRVCPRLDNDAVWRAGLWGQLSFVVHGVALILAGVTILTYGMTVVFVPQDLAYLGADASDIQRFDAELQALIAHDRATFGGMLVSGGVGLLLTSMWSFRHGDRWLLWTLGGVIFCPYVMTLWVHWDIGYRDHFHLTPVYIGLALLGLGLAASYRYLSGSRP